jgi:hypothetical protein
MDEHGVGETLTLAAGSGRSSPGAFRWTLGGYTLPSDGREFIDVLDLVMGPHSSQRTRTTPGGHERRHTATEHTAGSIVSRTDG